jgi:hypothetical protein
MIGWLKRRITVALQGKGYFIWQIQNVENGDVNVIANLAKAANFSHILIKIADGVGSYNIDGARGIDLVPPLVQALRARGIQPWGWHYIYGVDPLGEANRAIQRLNQLQLDGYVIDAEGEFKQPGKSEAAKKFMDRLRSALPNLPVALCSYRFPSFHPQIPWKVFLEKCDFNMPQVYWQNSHNPGEQLTRCVREFEAMTPYRPIVPAGSAYKSGTWAPTPGEIQEFLRTAQSLNLSAANFWEWSNTRKYLPDIWEAASSYPWSIEPPPQDITQQFVSALNKRDPELMTGFYTANAVHVNAARTIQGIPAIRAWYQSLFNQVLPNGTFSLTSFTGTGSSRHFSWTATSSAGPVRNGNDSLGLVDGKVGYHYTFFTVG